MHRFFQFIRNALRSLVVTRREEQIIEDSYRAAPHADLIRLRAFIENDIEALKIELAALSQTEMALGEIYDAIRNPARWMPDEPLTVGEATEWGNMLTGPLGIKIDTAMINFCAQQAQEAIAQTPDRIQHAAGVARGCVISWQLAKTLSRMANANVGRTETDPTTAQAGLEHYQP